tara:strand:- start:227 stop:862 length:636 start_codon:yes stop_codon:yes gene_type:complete
VRQSNWDAFLDLDDRFELFTRSNVNLILGLGNPGPEYELTRHNVGFMVVDALAKKHDISLKSIGYHCRFGRGEVDGFPVMIAKPTTYMNESGKAAKAMAMMLALNSSKIVVVHDEIDLIFGKIKVRDKGSDAGQRGVRSITRSLGTHLFTRIRIGVGRPENRDDIVDYVLSPFKKNEWTFVNDIVEQAVNKIETKLLELNNKKTQPEEETE